MSPTSLRITNRLEEMDIASIHRFLTRDSTWARGISFETVRKSLQHSLCFAGFVEASQVAFARVISDFATFANLVDVFVLPGHRGRGYGKQLMAAVVGHPELQGLRRFTLATSDAHGLYAPFGFKPLAQPYTFMERYDPEIYARPSGS